MKTAVDVLCIIAENNVKFGVAVNNTLNSIVEDALKVNGLNPVFAFRTDHICSIRKACGIDLSLTSENGFDEEISNKIEETAKKILTENNYKLNLIADKKGVDWDPATTPIFIFSPKVSKKSSKRVAE